MSKKICFWGSCGFFALLLLMACDKKRPSSDASFTRADSLTETYLALQDTMLQVWNTMIHDDNRKIRTMEHLLHELTISNPEKRKELHHFEEQLEALASMRYDQRSMSDAGLVIEYDFASNTLVKELISLAEAQREFAYNPTLQKLVDSIRAADQRVNNYRAEYDHIARTFNRFIERNRHTLEEIDDNHIAKRPLFQVAVE